MTEEELAAIEARLNAAAPFPWSGCGIDPIPTGDLPLAVELKSSRHKHGACTCGFVWSVPADAPVLEVIGGPWGDTWPSIRVKEDGVIEPFQDRMDYGEISREVQAATMKFIAKVPTDVAALLAEVRRLRAAIPNP